MIAIIERAFHFLRSRAILGVRFMLSLVFCCVVLLCFDFCLCWQWPWCLLCVVVVVVVANVHGCIVCFDVPMFC